jgi:hypothetical protein
MTEKKKCIVIPFDDEDTAIYVARCLKDYVGFKKFIKEVELDGTEEKVDYAYIKTMNSQRWNK